MQQTLFENTEVEKPAGPGGQVQRLVMPPVLDACCGPKMMWFDKCDARCIFVDLRVESYSIPPDKAYPSGTTISIFPDEQSDFTNLPFPDESFYHVVFDPPHIVRDKPTGTVIKKYGCLPKKWEQMISKGFIECFRVLKPKGTLIFKWCEVEIPLSKVLALVNESPLYGHRSGKKARTHWVAFLKE